MRIPRIFHPRPIAAASQLELEEGAARHIARVLRLGPGAPLILFDGNGGEYPGEIIAISKRGVTVALAERVDVEAESSLQVTLAQGISKGERMDYTIQKAVELGVRRIVPIDTERSVVSLKGEREERRLAHWQGVIVSACEQCGRNTLPQLLPVHTLESWLSQPLQGSGLLLDHRAEHSLATLEPSPPITLLIGPEGGLSDREREKAIAAGYRGLRLGPRVLRTETAALTALAALQSRWGDLA